MTVRFARAALAELDEIWTWNAKTYGNAHAQAYVKFLLDKIVGLATDLRGAHEVEGRPDLQFITVRKSLRGHGHVVVFHLDEGLGLIDVAHVFHTRQDWPTKLR